MEAKDEKEREEISEVFLQLEEQQKQKMKMKERN
jgi:hypothetical protein